MFLKLKNRINVAISRTKYKVYFVGDSASLCKNNLWKNVYTACYYINI